MKAPENLPEQSRQAAADQFWSQAAPKLISRYASSDLITPQGQMGSIPGNVPQGALHCGKAGVSILPRLEQVPGIGEGHLVGGRLSLADVQLFSVFEFADKFLPSVPLSYCWQASVCAFNALHLLSCCSCLLLMS